MSLLVHFPCPRRHSLQKLFSAFPDGASGLGLTLLRLAVSLTAILKGIGTLHAAAGPALIFWVIGLLEMVVGAALLIGFLTPIAGIVAAIGNGVAGVSLLLAFGTNARGEAFASINLAVISIALVLLGPGAFSVDARLFGRREIIIPEGRRTSRT